jgi:peptidoglycan/LPS O-acetylase OafA/YrhL
MATDAGAKPPWGFRITPAALEPQNNNLTLVRLVLASAVIVSHCYFQQTGLEEVDWLSPWLGVPVSWLAVDGFFFLSGFLVFRSLARHRDRRRFFLARLARMYPALLAFVLGATLLGIAYTTADLPRFFGGETLRFLLGNLSFVKAYYELTGVYCGDSTTLCTLNGSLWTLPWEMRCYLGLMLLSLLGLTGTRAMTFFVVPAAMLLMALWYLSGLQDMVHTHVPAATYWLDQSARLFPLFLAGCAAALWRERIRLHGGGVLLLLVVQLVAAHTPFAFLTRLLLIAYAVLYLGFRPLRWTPSISRLPDYSYGIYIYAYPVMVVVAAWWPGLSAGQLAFANLIAVLPFAAVSWHFLEKPVLEAFRRWSRRTGASRQWSDQSTPAEAN